MLLAMVVGSGIMGERLSGGITAIALLANTFATGAGLAVLILTFGPISGAHFNPAVTLSFALQRVMPWRDVPAYVLAQFAGGFAGLQLPILCLTCHYFLLQLIYVLGASQWFSEFVATFGLMAIILGCVRQRPSAVPWAVGAYITSAYWFTASTSFANPAVTLARSATNTFAGIRPDDVLAFIVFQLVGAIAATLLINWMLPAVQRPLSGTQSGSYGLV